MSIIEKTDREWQEILSPLAYKVTRKHGTERAFSHDNFPKEAGYFACVCCGTPLFLQADKFDSGTGWPSFTQPMAGAPIGESIDNSWFSTRTEVHCHLRRAFGPCLSRWARANGLAILHEWRCPHVSQR